MEIPNFRLEPSFFGLFQLFVIGTIKSYKTICLNSPLESEGPKLSNGTKKVDITDHHGNLM